MIHDNSTTVVHCVLDSYGSVPNIEEESYDTENSSASISLSSLRQHQRQPSRACAVRAGRPSEAVAGRARLPQLPAPAAPAHSRFGQYFCSNLYGRAPRGPRGVTKSDLIFLKWKCWVFALRLPQKGTNFEKPSKLEKNVKKHLFS